MNLQPLDQRELVGVDEAGWVPDTETDVEIDAELDVLLRAEAEANVTRWSDGTPIEIDERGMVKLDKVFATLAGCFVLTFLVGAAFGYYIAMREAAGVVLEALR